MMADNDIYEILEISKPLFAHVQKPPPKSDFDYGGFWIRFAAALIDALILTIPQSILGYLVGIAFVERLASADPLQNYFGFLIWSRGIAIAVAWLYFSLLESSSHQATLGKMATGLTVTDLTGNRISFGRATGRFFGRILSAIPLGLGFFVQPFTARRQTWHDILAGCLVLKAKKTIVETKSIKSQKQTIKMDYDPSNKYEHLSTIKKLKDDGILTQEEYEEEKKKLLSL